MLLFTYKSCDLSSERKLGMCASFQLCGCRWLSGFLQEHKLNFYNKNDIGDDTKVIFGIWRQG